VHGTPFALRARAGALGGILVALSLKHSDAILKSLAVRTNLTAVLLAPLLVQLSVVDSQICCTSPLLSSHIQQVSGAIIITAVFG
jgi:hypothetical protein